MPILKQEVTFYPADLFELAREEENEECHWWALYTMSRREKQLMRELKGLEVPFYAPIIKKRQRSPGGRIRESHLPLFPNYVFVFGDELKRYQAVTTGCVSKYLPAPRDGKLTRDLAQIQRLIDLGRPMTREARLTEGDPVRVKNGPFCDFEGVVIRRERKVRLVVWLRLLNQGVSAEFDEAALEPMM
ncbi:MAG: antitermination protein NusG [Planctomycetes bacterium]|nr:antitermination protein NusG [Planctomycetota bacterium]